MNLLLPSIWNKCFYLSKGLILTIKFHKLCIGTKKYHPVSVFLSKFSILNKNCLLVTKFRGLVNNNWRLASHSTRVVLYKLLFAQRNHLMIYSKLLNTSNFQNFCFFSFSENNTDPEMIGSLKRNLKFVSAIVLLLITYYRSESNSVSKEVTFY